MNDLPPAVAGLALQFALVGLVCGVYFAWTNWNMLFGVVASAGISACLLTMNAAFSAMAVAILNPESAEPLSAAAIRAVASLVYLGPFVGSRLAATPVVYAISYLVTGKVVTYTKSLAVVSEHEIKHINISVLFLFFVLSLLAIAAAQFSSFYRYRAF